jgi:hypothetical protein
LAKKLSFPQTIKLFKLIHDYWLVDSGLPDYSPDTSLTKALAEFQLDLRQPLPSEETNQEPQSSPTHHYYANTTKLKDFPLYRYLFNFPLYRYFISSVHRAFTSPQRPTDLRSYSALFIDTIKLTQLIDLWLRSVPLGSATNIMKFVSMSLTGNQQQGARFLQDKVYELFEQVALRTFNLKQNGTYQNLVTSLQEIAATESMDLMEESLDLMANRFLYQRLKKRTVVYHLGVMSAQLRLEIVFNLAKYRMGKLYVVEDDSLLALARSVENGMEENNSAASFKFLTLFDEFFGSFAADLMAAEATDERLVKAAVYLLEKFYLICASRFDAMLTGEFLW